MENRYMGVITGDLVTSMGGLDRGITYSQIATTMLKEVTRHDWYGVSKTEFFRGDSFQITVESPQSILEMAAFIRTYLISLTDVYELTKLDARLSISIEMLNKYSQYDESAYEVAYILSGRNLETMHKAKNMVFNSSHKALMFSLSSITNLLDNTITMLSKPQAEILKEALDVMDVNPPELAKKAQKSRQNIHKIIERSGTERVIESLMDCRKYITGII
ncbi:TPA: hypothetical protein G8N62_004641 [Salmonella enterica]|uniref:Uncharacterized protein n=2 Tax=Salmonella enterica TaxID=28901 RepID=A0A744JX44_SALER|nr:hypothetical protein [Citrobacter portucalensis]EAZ9290618.1 hypothetical protein [Salmonella enterica]ECI9404262.1 hypothetical protein [Salmonella enterica subsp. enterica]EDR6082190.1 hypothetical protein [Salmonella enterica subsp. enterica serovar Kibi]HBG9755498.1 hypothetical protein [Klebsiella oxytoca]EEF0417855.1 hypothetical protein [Salmonella enterica subsp. enterica serovar Kibi]